MMVPKGQSTPHPRAGKSTHAREADRDYVIPPLRGGSALRGGTLNLAHSRTH